MRKQLTVALACTTLLAGAVAANAANYDRTTAHPVEVNIHGASAQFGFWNAAAKDFVTETVANKGLGCTHRSTAIDSINGKTFGLVIGTSCAALGNKDVVIRYSSKASYDGIYAVQGITGTDGCTGTSRLMPDDAQVPAPTATTDTAAATALTQAQTFCSPVQLGASDVNGSSFTQSSAGRTAWNNATNYTIDGVNSPAFHGVSTTGLLDTQSLVVPFAFFVNNNVTVKTCGSTAPHFPLGQCTQETDCGGTNGTTTYCGAPATLDNISRLMAVQIFSGTAVNWQDFGAGFSSQNIVACYRHAGSGTHATLDKSVMFNNNWGATTQTAQTFSSQTDNGDWQQIFNVDTGTEMSCIANYAGGIGYADADSSQAGTTRLKYNGVVANRSNLRNGLYDTFYTHEHLFSKEANLSTDQKSARDKMITYVTVHAFPSNKADFWATAGEMVWTKGINDAGYPAYIAPATMTP